MNEDLKLLLDECIDRLNRGESIKACLADYPEHAEELEPLLKAMNNFRDACSTIPRPAATSTARQRLNAALVNANQGHRRQWFKSVPLFGRSRAWAAVSIIIVLALIGFGSYQALTPGTPTVLAQANFRMLVSDEANDIEDFQSLYVTITTVGVLRAGEQGTWEVFELDPSATVDLTRLQGLNAQEVWEGYIPEGQYRKGFIFIENAVGTLKTGGTVNVLVPSGNLQISKPFEVSAGGALVHFVYDITVVSALNQQGESIYILLPEIEQSGAGQEFHEVHEGELTLKVVDGDVQPGSNVTVLVAFEGNPVADALVKVNDKEIGSTDGNGRISFIVPNDDELEIEAVKGELEGELEVNLERRYHRDRLAIEVVEGDMLPGGNVTVLVTFKGNPVADALVTVNDEEVGSTDGDGRISFTIPADDDELEIEAVKGELEGEFEIHLDDDLVLHIEDNLVPGNTATVRVTLNRNAVNGAVVTVNDKEIGTTGEDGRISFEVPAANKLEIKAELGEFEGELEISLGHGLRLRLESHRHPGDTATILVTLNRKPVQGVEVKVNDEHVGTTNENGRVSFEVPDTDELDIEARLGELVKKIEVEVESHDGHYHDGDWNDGDWNHESQEGDRDPDSRYESHEGINGSDSNSDSDHETYEGHRDSSSEWESHESNTETWSEQESHENRLTLEVTSGEPGPGGNMTVLVTFEGSPVAGARVFINSIQAGTTDEDGKLTFTVPDDSELEIKAVNDGMEGKLEFEL